MTLTVANQISEEEFAGKCESLILQYIRKSESIDDKERHLRVIDCGRLYSGGRVPNHWDIFVAVLSDGGSDGGFLHFSSYGAHIDMKSYDPSKSVEEQLKIRKDDSATLDLYLKSGNLERDMRPFRALRALVDELESKYLLGPPNYYGNQLPPRLKG